MIYFIFQEVILPSRKLKTDLLSRNKAYIIPSDNKWFPFFSGIVGFHGVFRLSPKHFDLKVLVRDYKSLWTKNQ